MSVTLNANQVLEIAKKSPGSFHDEADAIVRAKQAIANLKKLQKIGPDKWDKQQHAKKGFGKVWAYEVSRCTIEVSYSATSLASLFAGTERVIVRFSGSNDCGGIDSIEVTQGKPLSDEARRHLEDFLYTKLEHYGANFNNEGCSGDGEVDLVTGDGSISLYHNIVNEDSDETSGTASDIEVFRSLKKSYPQAVTLLAEYGYNGRLMLVDKSGRRVNGNYDDNKTITNAVFNFMTDLDLATSSDNDTHYELQLDLNTFTYTATSKYSDERQSDEDNGGTFNIYEETAP